ncbi:MAG: hypothetical protein AVDCRST_MAG73-2829, partial [uncultured Thermomicrobiales bacterium]
RWRRTGAAWRGRARSPCSATGRSGSGPWPPSTSPAPPASSTGSTPASGCGTWAGRCTARGRPRRRPGSTANSVASGRGRPPSWSRRGGTCRAGGRPPPPATRRPPTFPTRRRGWPTTASAPPAGTSAAGWWRGPASTSSGRARRGRGCAGATPGPTPWPRSGCCSSTGSRTSPGSPP